MKRFWSSVASHNCRVAAWLGLISSTFSTLVSQRTAVWIRRDAAVCISTPQSSLEQPGPSVAAGSVPVLRVRFAPVSGPSLMTHRMASHGRQQAFRAASNLTCQLAPDRLREGTDRIDDICSGI